MRYLPHLLGLVFVATLAGCSSSVTLPPVKPENVDVFLPGSLPKEDYKVMSRFQITGELNTPDQELINRARAQAAEKGADGVIITALRRTSEGGVELNLSQEQQKILEAQAVYYPSRLPDLKNK